MSLIFFFLVKTLNSNRLSQKEKSNVLTYIMEKCRSFRHGWIQVLNNGRKHFLTMLSLSNELPSQAGEW